MKKIFSLLLISWVPVLLYAQACPGTDQFYPNKTAHRMGSFTPPNDSEDSIGCYSLVIGIGTKAKGQASFATGSYNNALGAASFATGNSNTASGFYSSVIGAQNIAAGYASFAAGYFSKAMGDYAAVFGVSCEANANAAFAGGGSSKANGIASFAFGASARASGQNSFSAGNNSIAAANESIAMGYYSQASGVYSFANGSYASARATSSIAMGAGTVSKVMTGSAYGTYNDSTDSPNPLVYGLSDRVFQVGIGYNDASRRNALTVLRDGNIGIGELVPTTLLSIAGIGSNNMVTVKNTDNGSVLKLSNEANGASPSVGTATNHSLSIVTNNTTRATVTAAGNVGIGVTNPGSKLEIRGPLGFSSSNKKWEMNYDSTNNYFYIDELGVQRRMVIRNGGNVGIGTLLPLYKLEVVGDVKNSADLHVGNNLHVDYNNANAGDTYNALRFGGATSGEAIASKRIGSLGENFGLNFYTNRVSRMIITNAGNVGIGNDNPVNKLDVAGNTRVTGNVVVQSNKGIIRSNDGTQQKKLVATVTVATSFAGDQTKLFNVTWPEAFSANPDAFVGSLVAGSGGWAEVVMSLGAATTTGVTLYVYNPRGTTVNPNFTVKVIAIGAQ